MTETKQGRSDSPRLKAQHVGTKLQLRPNERPTRPTRVQKPRLARDDYIGRRTYHITLPTAQRTPLFEDLELGRQFEAALVEIAGKLQFTLLAYCFMPDHLHVLLMGTSTDSNLLRLVQRFKQVTGFRFKALSGDRPWQQSFFDRVLRRDDDRTEVARYILLNPVTAGLHADHPAFALKGGLLLRDAAADGASSLHVRTRRQVRSLVDRDPTSGEQP